MIRFDCRRYIGDEDCKRCAKKGYIYECPTECADFVDNERADYIEYTCQNGYRGVLYGKSSLKIYRPDGLCFHTDSRKINTLKELEVLVKSFPDFDASNL